MIKRYMEIDKVSNGWIVVVHTDFRDKEVSPETAAARAQAKLETARKTKEAAVKSLKLQLEAAKLLKDEMVNEGEDWKGDESESFDDKLKGLVDEMYSQYQGTEQQPMVLTSLGSAFGLNTQTETRVFTNRQDMIAFVTEMLEPIIE